MRHGKSGTGLKAKARGQRPEPSYSITLTQTQACFSRCFLLDMLEQSEEQSSFPYTGWNHNSTLTSLGFFFSSSCKAAYPDVLSLYTSPKIFKSASMVGQMISGFSSGWCRRHLIF